MSSLYEALQWGKSLLQEPREVEDLLISLLGVDRSFLYLNSHFLVSATQKEEFLKALQRRLQGEPLLYILGETQFYQTKIKLSSAVLIPRPETEILVEKVVNALEKENLEGKVLLDLCTGSGCMGISIKKKFPSLRVILSDICPQALAIARHNALENKADVEILEGNFLEPFLQRGYHCDYLVSNPPYIAQEELSLLSPEVRDFEPQKALLGGENGLFFYRRLAKDIDKILKPKGKVWLEIGHRQGEALKTLFPHSSIFPDWAGHDRFFFLEKQL